ncbi:MAG: amino acid adenylation domain-containing protein [Bacteroidetes bacterium]|nr:amino acid adenylation domain-containing protein [Bacteroidota bacterium]
MLERIVQTVEQHGLRPALEVGDAQWTYRELWNAAATVAKTVREADLAADVPVTLFSARQMETYAALLGTLISGHPYLPVNLKFPAGRVARIVDTAESSIYVVSREFVSLFRVFMDGHNGEVYVITFEQSVADEVRQLENVTVTVLDLTPVTKQDASLLLPVDFSRFVYILFTSGTTGEPKGIPISHGNLNAYLDHILTSYDIKPEDRCSQAFDITFDPSVHDIFVTWSAGACLCPLSQADLLLPNRFITSRRLTVWYSVPSIALRMKQVRMLKEGAFPLLRYSIFSGEALPAHVAESWQAAAPSSIVVNYYGPTEVTINVTEHCWDPQKSPSIVRNGVVPIGTVFPNSFYRVVASSGDACPPGIEGELLVGGPQVSEGYLRDPERSELQFVLHSGDSQVRWYRTGDRVIELVDGTLLFLGRVDHQVQIRGYRVEPAEVEEVLRLNRNVVEAVVLPLVDEGGLAVGLRAWVIAGGDTRTADLLRECKNKLPVYMVPDRVVLVPSFPLTVNGKIDRTKLYGVG